MDDGILPASHTICNMFFKETLVCARFFILYYINAWRSYLCTRGPKNKQECASYISNVFYCFLKAFLIISWISVCQKGWHFRNFELKWFKINLNLTLIDIYIRIRSDHTSRAILLSFLQNALVSFQVNFKTILLCVHEIDRPKIWNYVNENNAMKKLKKKSSHRKFKI